MSHRALGSQWDTDQRMAVYRVHDSLPLFDRLTAVSDEEAKEMASKMVGRSVEIARIDHPHTEGRLLGKWVHPKGVGDTPVIYAPHNYSLSPHEIAHEAAHLHTDRLGIRLAHGRTFRDNLLEFLPRDLRDHFESGFRSEGLL